MRTILTYLESFKMKEYLWITMICKQAMISRMTRQRALRTTRLLLLNFKSMSQSPPPPEPGPSHASCASQVFDMGLTVNMMRRKKGKRSQIRVGTPIFG